MEPVKEEFREEGGSSLDRSTSGGRTPSSSKAGKMWLKKSALGRRGGVVLDSVLVILLVLLAASALDFLGITFAELLRGAVHFFGI